MTDERPTVTCGLRTRPLADADPQNFFLRRSANLFLYQQTNSGSMSYERLRTGTDRNPITSVSLARIFFSSEAALSVCLSVSVCLPLCNALFKKYIFDMQVRLQMFRRYTLSSCIKVIGSMSRSQEQKRHKISSHSHSHNLMLL